MKLRAVLQNVPDPRGKQRQDYPLWSILGLIVVSLLSGRRGMRAAFRLGRSLRSYDGKWVTERIKRRTWFRLRLRFRR